MKLIIAILLFLPRLAYAICVSILLVCSAFAQCVLMMIKYKSIYPLKKFLFVSWEGVKDACGFAVFPFTKLFKRKY